MITTNNDHHKQWSPQTMITTNNDYHKQWSPQTMITTNNDHHKQWSLQTMITTNNDLWAKYQWGTSGEGGGGVHGSTSKKFPHMKLFIYFSANIALFV
jgi:hypothetical protein